MAPVRTSHHTDPLPAPYAIPRNPHWGKDGLGAIDKPIAPTRYQNQLPNQSRTAMPNSPRPIPHRLAGQNWPSTSTDLGGGARLDRDVQRGRGRGRGRNRVVPITRAPRGRPKKAREMSIKAELGSLSPKTGVNFDREAGPEPVSGIDVLEGLVIKAEPDIQSSPTLMRDHDQDRPHASTHHLYDGQSNEGTRHPSRVPIVRLNSDVVKDSTTLNHQEDQRVVDYRIPAPNAVFNTATTSDEVYPSRLPSQKANPADQATTVDTRTVDDVRTVSSASTSRSTASSGPLSTIASSTWPTLEPALPIVAGPIRRPPPVQAVPTHPEPATSLLNIDPFGFGIPADLSWFEDDGFTPRADEYNPDGIALWVVECENVLKHIKSLPPRLPLRGTAQERTRAAIYLRKLVGEWITLVFDDHLVGDPPTVGLIYERLYRIG